MRKFVCQAIRRYQARGGGRRYFGLDCNFHQTCSEYTLRAIEDVGVRQGMRLGWSRLKRCNQPDLVRKLDDPYEAA